VTPPPRSFSHQRRTGETDKVDVRVADDRHADFPPAPWTMFTTPSGTPASARISTRAEAVAGVSEAGLKTTVLPQRRAGNIFHVGIAMGKFHGVTIPATPIGTRIAMLNLSGSSEGTVFPKRRRPSPPA